MTEVAPGAAVDPGLLWTRRGVVSAFSDEEGIGTVTDGGDGRVHPFHCTAIAGGSRRIAPGTAVSFVLAPGHLGQLEARDLVPLG